MGSFTVGTNIHLLGLWHVQGFIEHEHALDTLEESGDTDLDSGTDLVPQSNRRLCWAMAQESSEKRWKKTIVI